MGFALASAALALGAEVRLICGPVHLTPPAGVAVDRIETTTDLHDAVHRHLDWCDCLIMAAAPADFAPAHPAASKLKRSGSGLNIELAATEDILASLRGKRRPGQVLVGFALETDNGLAHARHKLVAKNLDLIVLNEVGINTGFDVDTNAVRIIFADGSETAFPTAPKETIARQIVEILASRLRA